MGVAPGVAVSLLCPVAAAPKGVPMAGCSVAVGPVPKMGFFGVFHPLMSVENFLGHVGEKYHMGWKSPCAAEFKSGLSETLGALFSSPLPQTR